MDKRDKLDDGIGYAYHNNNKKCTTILYFITVAIIFTIIGFMVGLFTGENMIVYRQGALPKPPIISPYENANNIVTDDIGLGIFFPEDNIFGATTDKRRMNRLSKVDKNRLAEAEEACSKRKCCREDDDDATDSSDCSSYSYKQCLSESNACVWDCSKSRKGSKLRYKTRTFKGISRNNAKKFEMDHKIPETEKDRMAGQMDENLKIDSVDDCGTMYEYELQDESLKEEINKFMHRVKSEHKENTGNQAKQRKPNTRRKLENEIINMSLGGPMNDTLRRKLGVLDDDDRAPITSWTNPYYKVVYLSYTIGTGATWMCSGALITERHVLTAGHCVSDGNGNWYSNFQAKPSHNAGGSATFGWVSAMTFSAWHYNKNWDWDIAVITLDTTSTNYGWFGFGWHNGIDSNWDFRLAGYPTDIPNQIMQTQEVDIDGFSNSEILRSTTIDFVRGNSGGPLFLPTTYGLIYGVGSYEAWRQDVNGNILWYTYNDMVRLTQTKFDTICNYINGWAENGNTC